MGFWKRYVAAVIVNAAVTLAVLCVRGFGLKIYYVDAFSVGGAVSILLGLLGWVASAGAFDTIGYGFSTLGGNRRYKNLYEYIEGKKEKRGRQNRPFLPFLATGLVFLAVSLVISAFV